MTRVLAAAVQAAPVFMDRDATVERACSLIDEAGSRGAGLIVLPEAFIPGYPDFVWRLPAWQDGSWYETLHDQSIEIPSAAIDSLAASAGNAHAWVAVGVNERAAGSTTLYNTLLYFSPDGTLAGLHRKLMPTGGERTVWGQGDGSTLTVLDTAFGRMGGLLCWENYMPLARAAMWAKQVDVYLAPTWDNSDTWIASMRHIAKEGGVYVIATNTCMRGADVPLHLPGAKELYGDEKDWLSKGNTMVAGPDGTVLAGPLIGETGTLFVELDTEACRRQRRQFDVVGHYARPDIFQLQVDDRPHQPVSFGASAHGPAVGSPA